MIGIGNIAHEIPNEIKNVFRFVDALKNTSGVRKEASTMAYGSEKSIRFQ